ncbi:tRNA glutamyl-Q(34) synthetase GluQRS [Ilumatobacter sp.]|uniref:tRNA glutamyl-Q(34) synthetase GluQRS n=1 Tax=Ilumatobacter sp. TaxID=1967498 RepID=UPI003C4AB0DE
MSGRFAPSPTGSLHLGNLRTALLAWLAARSTGLGFIVRMEDLDRVQAAPEHEAAQLRDLAAIGLDWDSAVVRQSERFDLYRDALAELRSRGLVYECFCSRREVRAEIENSPNAPHLPPGSYPGTCRHLTSARRQRFLDDGRKPALRLRADESMGTTDPPESGATDLIGFTDLVAGRTEGGVDDVVLQRNDGVPAYNLAVVVDDSLQGITQVVRGDDLLTSTPRQIHLQRLLGLPTPTYAHVPLVMGDDGERLSKRHGSVSLEELRSAGATVEAVVGELLASSAVEIDVSHDLTRSLRAAAASFDVSTVTRSPVEYQPDVEADATFSLRNTV